MENPSRQLRRQSCVRKSNLDPRFSQGAKVERVTLLLRLSKGQQLYQVKLWNNGSVASVLS